MPTDRGFSFSWVWASFAMFLCVELLLSGLVGNIIGRGFLGHVAALKLEVILMLASFFLGGWLIGLLSPGVRMIEPALGAGLAVASTFLITLFTPSVFYCMSTDKVLKGGLVAFVLALLGARLGEKAAARMGDRASQAAARRL